ncbi:trehalose 6-phosphate synthase [Alteromonadaceae bacterium 2753L.S.0a.02]|nr:trehalose 6-phosphate synthase [Alteromonadaceae bacterium 2753L.S.0a.02]
MSRLVVVSNRVAKPTGAGGSQGGLAVGVFAAMAKAGGLWFGWNGKLISSHENLLETDKREKIDYATISLRKTEYNQYYKGFANSVLWPLFHHRPELMEYHHADFLGYHMVNKKFADSLLPLLKADDIIWVHDYHLIPLAKQLRQRGIKSRIGFFLHTPFPAFDLLRAMPEYREILRELMHYDLIGFQTETDVRGFRESMKLGLNATITGNQILCENKRATVNAYPIGIETEAIPDLAQKGKVTKDYERLKESLGNRKLIIGVDRLDYSKGIENRFLSYEKLLQHRSDFLRSLVYLQVSPTSRGDVQAYGDFAKRIDRIAGHIIGTYADFDWMPLRYLNRGFRRNTVLAMSQLARVGFVTPLRDGMNLVAKEYVAAQNPDDPGVLVLSKMAGAAAELDAAVIVNPYDIESVAKHLANALEMPLDERKDRWQKMMAVLRKNDIYTWQRKFLEDLEKSASAQATEINSELPSSAAIN